MKNKVVKCCINILFYKAMSSMNPSEEKLGALYRVEEASPVFTDEIRTLDGPRGILWFVFYRWCFQHQRFSTKEEAQAFKNFVITESEKSSEDSTSGEFRRGLILLYQERSVPN